MAQLEFGAALSSHAWWRRLPRQGVDPLANAPMPSAHDTMKGGEASFEETIQLQVESWIQAAERPELTAPLGDVPEADTSLFDWSSDALADCISPGVLVPELAQRQLPVGSLRR